MSTPRDRAPSAPQAKPTAQPQASPAAVPRDWSRQIVVAVFLILAAWLLINVIVGQNTPTSTTTPGASPALITPTPRR